MACFDSTNPKDYTGRISFSQNWPGADIQAVWPPQKNRDVNDPDYNTAYKINQTVDEWNYNTAYCLGYAASNGDLHMAYFIRGESDNELFRFKLGSRDKPYTFKVNKNSTNRLPFVVGVVNKTITIEVSDYSNTDNGDGTNSVSCKMEIKVDGKVLGHECVTVSGNYKP